MKIYNESFVSDMYTAVALGFFDGVHLGHREIIKKTVGAKAYGLNSVVFSFEQSPQSVIKDIKPRYLTDNKRKQKILSAMGVDYLVMADFNRLKDLSCSDFVKEYLVDRLNAKIVFCGFNFTFGANGEGNIDTLRELCSEFNIKTIVISPIMVENEIVSSTKIKSFVESGEIEKANEMLGENISFCLPVIGGNGVGKSWGFPTANQAIPEDCICPKYGVYISKVMLKGMVTYAITNIGVKPTVGGKSELIESYIPSYNGEDFYGEYITTELLHFVRQEKRFDSIEILKEQISKDLKSFYDFTKKIKK